ncbi:MAG: outer membrane lipoprotein carrier protein LolA [Candidatus Paracaedibacteraceae bacterium]|nr:outer membrane lipoprotein carrier protein LolA [Candidatus Paracaedibacteraceae bacterium]
MTYCKKICCVLAFLVLKTHLSVAGMATTNTSEIHKNASPEAIKIVTTYWNKLQILVASIIQTNPDGKRITGKLYLKKGKGNNAKLRLDYQPDYKQQMLIKKSEVLLVDLTDGAVSAYPVSMTPASLILKPKLDFEKDVKLIDSQQVGKDVQIVLAHKDDENGGLLILNFTIANGGCLLRWKVLDPQGNMTEVELIGDTMRENDSKLVPDVLFE